MCGVAVGSLSRRVDYKWHGTQAPTKVVRRRGGSEEGFGGEGQEGKFGGGF